MKSRYHWLAESESIGSDMATERTGKPNFLNNILERAVGHEDRIVTPFAQHLRDADAIHRRPAESERWCLRPHLQLHPGTMGCWEGPARQNLLPGRCPHLDVHLR